MAWDYLTPSDRYHVALQSPPFEAYARLRRSTITVSIYSLKESRPPPDSFIGLQKARAWQMAVALMRFDFDLGDLIRWLEGEYTNSHRDWQTLSDTMNAVRSIDPPAGYPRIDYEWTFRACTEGVPLSGHYQCSFESVRSRNRYDNHPNIQEVRDEIRTKLAKEEAQSFYIAFPCFIWHFILGIHLAPLVWNVRKGKGRLCADPSNTISRDDDGAANTNIPSPGTPDREDECPSIYYAMALHRHLTHIWNLRITDPRRDILQFVDDIQAAFHRILYHPEGMKAFCSVFCEFLLVPIGTIFGGRNSPSFFCLFSETRSHVASNGVFRPNDDPENLSALARQVRLVPAPTERERHALVPAVADSHHQGILPEHQNRYHNSTFVDDNGIAEYREKMLGAIDNSVRAAHAIFGEPDDDRRKPALSEEKWLLLASFAMLYLGFYIDTRRMIMAWPVEKRQQLATLLDDIFARRSPVTITPQEGSALLGFSSECSTSCPPWGLSVSTYSVRSECRGTTGLDYAPAPSTPASALLAFLVSGKPSRYGRLHIGGSSTLTRNFGLRRESPSLVPLHWSSCQARVYSRSYW
jgi:hypothetical protein